MKKLTEPLKSAFAITQFWHYSIREDGMFTYLSNDPEISEYYYDLELYKTSPLFRHPRQVRSAYVLSNTWKDEGYIQSQGEMEKKFNLQFPFLILRKEEDHFRGFGFTTQNRDFPLDHVCVNHLVVLNKFCDYFLEETSFLEKEQLEQKVNLSTILDATFNKPMPSSTHTSFNLYDFYKKIGKTHQWSRGKLDLSRQEKRCLAHLIQGKTYREIGEALNLSPRSVETYFLVIKDKLNCQTKSKLFSRAHELNQFGLL